MNSILPVIYGLAFLANAAASIFWGVRYKRASEQLVAAKEAQIATLRELSSSKVLEHFQATKSLLEDSIRAKDDEIRALKDDQISRLKLVENSEAIRETLEAELKTLEEEMNRLRATTRNEMLRSYLAGGLGQRETPLTLRPKMNKKMAQCRCESLNHENHKDQARCTAEATENDGLCRPCHEKAADEAIKSFPPTNQPPTK